MNQPVPSAPYGFALWLAVTIGAAGLTLLVMLLLRRKRLPHHMFTSLLILSLLLLAGSIGLAVLVNARSPDTPRVGGTESAIFNCLRVRIPPVWLTANHNPEA